jgi:hypothetical protein
MIKVEQTKVIEQYLAYERASLNKNEFLFHNIIPMAGASYEHNIIRKFFRAICELIILLIKDLCILILL